MIYSNQVASGFYKRIIVEGKVFLVFAALVALITRLATLLSPQLSPSDFYNSGGYIWDFIAPFFENRIASVVGSSLSVAAIAFLLSYINTKNILIRHKTLLPASISLLLFSVHPSFMFMGAHYLGVIFLLLIISLLFAFYQDQGEKVQNVAVKIGFLIAICSLFFFDIFLYLPAFIVGMFLMRIMRFKSFLAFLLGLGLTYIPVFTYYFFTGNIQGFTYPFVAIFTADLSIFPLLGFGVEQWVMFSFGFLIFLLFFINAYVNSFKDKIKIREFLQLLSVFCIYAFLLLLFVNIDTVENLYIVIGIGSILYAHLFALVDRTSMQLVFYLSLIFCLSSTIAFFAFL